MAATIAKRPQKHLQRIKDNIDQGLKYFDQNYKRFNESRKFIYQTSLTKDDVDNLTDLGKPILEFNILETFIDRLIGEFVKHDPSVEVCATHSQPIPVDIRTIQLVDGILRAIMEESRKRGHTVEIYKDVCSGGYSVWEIYTDYETNMGFDQKFCLRRVDDPTLVGFDPLAQESHKGDGDYCYKVYPRTIDEVTDKYGDLDLKDVKFTRNLAGYSWSYKNEKSNAKILMLADYYEKKKVPTTIHRLANGMVLTDKQYKSLLTMYEDKRIMAQPPVIIESRTTELCTICRYTVIENQILDYEETDYPALPLIFVDGNSVLLKNMNGPVEQMTRPITYHARDLQRLKNFAGQTIANHFENIIQHKLVVAKEAIPAEYKNVYKDIQHADLLVYNQYQDNDPNKPLQAPQPIPLVPLPPEVTNVFMALDQMSQSILGGFDLSIGKLSENQISGIAIQESLTAANANAMPVINGYLLALNHVLQIIVDMIPKYYVTPRTVPTIDANGKRNFYRVNDPNDPKSIPLDYYTNALRVSVEAGLNFSVQKSRTLQSIIYMMQASPLFAQFMNQMGLRILIDNMELSGGDQLKLLADQFMAQIQKQQAQAAQQPNPLMVKAQLEQAKLAQSAQADQRDFQLRAAELRNDANANENDRLEIILEAEAQKRDDVVQMAKASAEMDKAKLDSTLKVHEHALKATDQMHRHAHDTAQFHHQVEQANKTTTTGETQHGES